MTGGAPLLSLALLSTTLPAASPSPEPTELREIGRVSASALCRTLARLVLPVTLVVERNEGDFFALETPVAKFRSGKGDDGGAMALHNALAQTAIGLQALATSDGIAAAQDPLAGEDDDEGTYTPQRTMAASNIDRIVGEIQHNLVVAGKVMAESWKSDPGKSDAAVNALRQRLQNVIDLQRVLAFRFDDVAGTYFSNMGNARANRASERGQYKALLDQILDAQIAENEAARASLSSAPSPAPSGDVESLKRGAAGEVAAALRSQEMALSSETATAERSCKPVQTEPAPSLAP